jgi:hypothetical protein
MLYGKFTCSKCGKREEGDVNFSICTECCKKSKEEENKAKDILWNNYYNKEISCLDIEVRLQRIERWIFERAYIINRIEPLDG